MVQDLTRFESAHREYYSQALAEIRSGKKRTHWMWFIFPQLKELGRSDTAKFYGIEDLGHAADFLNHPVLGNNLLEISTALLGIDKNDAREVFGYPDDLKLRSSMTLFAAVDGAPGVFNAVLRKYFGGIPDDITLKLLKPKDGAF